MGTLKKIIKSILNVRESEELKQRELMEEARASYNNTDKRIFVLDEQIVKKVKIDKD